MSIFLLLSSLRGLVTSGIFFIYLIYFSLSQYPFNGEREREREKKKKKKKKKEEEEEEEEEEALCLCVCV